MTQLTIYDEMRPKEPTREEKIVLLEQMANDRMKEADFWQEHGRWETAQHLRDCAAGDRRLAAMLRR